MQNVIKTVGAIRQAKRWSWGMEGKIQLGNARLFQTPQSRLATGQIALRVMLAARSPHSLMRVPASFLTSKSNLQSQQ